MTAAASGYSPTAKAPSVAMAIRNFSSKTWPWAMLRIAPQSTSQPMTRYGTAKASAFHSPSSGSSAATSVSRAAATMRKRVFFCRRVISG